MRNISANCKRNRCIGADGLDLHQLYRAMAWLGDKVRYDATISTTIAIASRENGGETMSSEVRSRWVCAPCPRGLRPSEAELRLQAAQCQDVARRLKVVMTGNCGSRSQTGRS
jgi:hypothetical protein